MKYSCILLITFGLVSGCSTTAGLSDQMADWQGSNAGTAIASWGEPEIEKAFGDETILIWRDRAYDPPQTDIGTILSSAAVVCERMLAVTDDGTITGWRWRGDACPVLHDDIGNTQLLSSNRSR